MIARDFCRNEGRGWFICAPGGEFHNGGTCEPCSQLCEDRWGESYCTGKEEINLQSHVQSYLSAL